MLANIIPPCTQNKQKQNKQTLKHVNEYNHRTEYVTDELHSCVSLLVLTDSISMLVECHEF